MTNREITVLVAEDDPVTRSIIAGDLVELGYRVVEAVDGADASTHLRAADILLTDLIMPRMDGMALLEHARTERPEMPVIMLTAHATVEAAVQAMQKGAADFVEKPFRQAELEMRLRRVVERLDERRRIERLERQNELLNDLAPAVDSQAGFEQMIGRSPVMREVFRKIEMIAPSGASVLILGESGTGKELVARAIHMRSRRSAGPFVKMNCSVFSEGVIESELFGHEKGAFTGALKTRIGRFELADGGTIFLDEIGDLSPSMQIKLLRVLQEREFERVGATDSIRVDVRVISATNRDLKEAMDSGRFREDLYFRMNVVTIEMPPLRERGDDLELLVDHLRRKFGRELNRKRGFSKDALDALKRYRWPGNVRELENVVQTVMLLSTTETIDEWDLPPALNRGVKPGADGESTALLTDRLRDFERVIIEESLARNSRNISRTARALGLERNALKYKLRKHGLLPGGRR